MASADSSLENGSRLVAMLHDLDHKAYVLVWSVQVAITKMISTLYSSLTLLTIYFHSIDLRRIHARFDLSSCIDFIFLTLKKGCVFSSRFHSFISSLKRRHHSCALIIEPHKWSMDLLAESRVCHHLHMQHGSDHARAQYMSDSRIASWSKQNGNQAKIPR